MPKYIFKKCICTTSLNQNLISFKKGEYYDYRVKENNNFTMVMKRPEEHLASYKSELDGYTFNLHFKDQEDHRESQIADIFN